MSALRNNFITENCDKHTPMERKCKIMINLGYTFLFNRESETRHLKCLLIMEYDDLFPAPPSCPPRPRINVNKRSLEYCGRQCTLFISIFIVSF